jgi:hypothetical protein
MLNLRMFFDPFQAASGRTPAPESGRLHSAVTAIRRRINLTPVMENLSGR